MKIVFCTYDDPTFSGGPNSWLRRLLPALRTHGVEAEVLFFVNGTAPSDCPCFSALSQQGFRCYAFPWQSTTQEKIYWILSQLSKTPPDIFVPNFIVGALYASRWLKQAGIPTVGVLHSDDAFYHGVIQEFVLGQKDYRLSALVCVSDFLTQAVKALGHTETHIKKIPCGVSLPPVSARKPNGRLRIVYLGRLVEEQKQISKVASSLCLTVRELPNTEAFIFGEGNARANIQAVLASEGKGLPVYLGGLIDNSEIQNVLADAHVFVLLSDYEGLPVSLLEAMACGVVPVCLDIRSGIPELVEHDRTGLLVNNRENDFVNAIRSLLNEPDRWERLSKSAQAKVATFYSNEFCASAWKDLLLSLQSKSLQKKSLSYPKRLSLPPINPAFAPFERRDAHFLSKATRALKQRVSMVKNISLRV